MYAPAFLVPFVFSFYFLVSLSLSLLFFRVPIPRFPSVVPLPTRSALASLSFPLASSSFPCRERTGATRRDVEENSRVSAARARTRDAVKLLCIYYRTITNDISSRLYHATIASRGYLCATSEIPPKKEKEAARSFFSRIN